MSAYIRHYVETCGVCATCTDKQPTESLVKIKASPLPWHKVGSDLFSRVKTDYNGGLFELGYLPDASPENR